MLMAKQKKLTSRFPCSRLQEQTRLPMCFLSFWTIRHISSSSLDRRVFPKQAKNKWLKWTFQRPASVKVFRQQGGRILQWTEPHIRTHSRIPLIFIYAVHQARRLRCQFIGSCCGPAQRRTPDLKNTAKIVYFCVFLPQPMDEIIYKTSVAPGYRSKTHCSM